MGKFRERKVVPSQPASYRLIALTRGMYAKVDIEDFDRINTHSWRAMLNRNTGCYYAATNLKIDGRNRSSFGMHTMVMNPSPGMEVDHRNRSETLDNRKENLRLATRSQNQANRRLQKNNTSGYRGVAFVKNMGLWRAQTQKNREKTRATYFSSKHEAAREYNRLALELHGEFAVLNEVPDGL